MTQIQAHKAVAYAVEQPLGGVRAHKAVAYVVEQQALFLQAHKAVAYAVEQGDFTGNARQETPDDRPTYRAGPLPHVEFGAGDSLVVNLPFGGSFTIATLQPDQTFTVAEVTLPAGLWILPAVNFNQVALLADVGLPSIVIASLRRTMRARAGLPP